MRDHNTDENGADTSARKDAPSPEGELGTAPQRESEPDSDALPPPDETIVEELGAVIDDAKLYAAAELAFQKTRAKLLGKSVGVALGAIVVALILLHIALIAMAVGLVIALEPLVTIWGAIAIVVGIMLLGVAALGLIALSKGRLIGEMFSGDANERPPNQEDRV